MRFQQVRHEPIDGEALACNFRPRGAMECNGGEFVDFHAMRHSCITRLNRAGTPLPTAMSLARHADPMLTLEAYDHANDADRRAAIAAAFGGTAANTIERQPAATTQNGHDAEPETEPESPAGAQIRRCPVRPGTQSTAQPRTFDRRRGHGPDERLNITKWLHGNRICIDSHEDAPPSPGQTKGTPRRTRTFNPLIRGPGAPAPRSSARRPRAGGSRWCCP